MILSHILLTVQSGEFVCGSWGLKGYLAETGMCHQTGYCLRGLDLSFEKGGEIHFVESFVGMFFERHHSLGTH